MVLLLATKYFICQGWFTEPCEIYGPWPYLLGPSVCDHEGSLTGASVSLAATLYYFWRTSTSVYQCSCVLQVGLLGWYTLLLEPVHFCCLYCQCLPLVYTWLLLSANSSFGADIAGSHKTENLKKPWKKKMLKCWWKGNTHVHWGQCRCFRD